MDMWQLPMERELGWSRSRPRHKIPIGLEQAQLGSRRACMGVVERERGKTPSA